MSQTRREKSSLNGWFWDRLEPFGAISAWPGSARLGSVRLGPALPRSARLGSALAGRSSDRLGPARLRPGRPGPARHGLGFFLFFSPQVLDGGLEGKNVLSIVKTYVFDKKSGRWLGEEKIADSGIVWGCLGHLGAALLGSAQLGPGPA